MARLLTYRMPGGPPEILATIFRMPTGRSPADNFALGGLASVIDEMNGRLWPAVRKSPNHPAGTFSHHPDTGQRIEGFSLPFWDEIKDLCLTAQEQFRDFPSVGWDVAITDRGCLLLEGNHDWCVDLVQQSYGSPLGKTAYVDHYLAYVGDRL